MRITLSKMKRSLCFIETSIKIINKNIKMISFKSSKNIKKKDMIFLKILQKLQIWDKLKIKILDAIFIGILLF